MNQFCKLIGSTTLFLLFAADGLSQDDPAKQPTPEEMASKLGVELPQRPWHLADIWWEFPEATDNFESLSMEVTIDRDISTAYNLYIAPVGIAEINGLRFYGGIQSNINGWASKKSRTRVHPGKGAIFSRWSSDEAQPIGLDHVRLAANGLCESAGYEGEFASVRRPFQWTKGTYTYSIVKGDTETIDSKTHSWFHCMILSHENQTSNYVGSLRFEGKEFTFWGRHAAFVEVYSTAKIPKSAIPAVNVTFGYPRINGETKAAKKVLVNYNPSRSPQCAIAKADGGSVIVEVGKLFQRDKTMYQQRLQLNPKALSEKLE